MSKWFIDIIRSKLCFNYNFFKTKLIFLILVINIVSNDALITEINTVKYYKLFYCCKK